MLGADLALELFGTLRRETIDELSPLLALAEAIAELVNAASAAFVFFFLTKDPRIFLIKWLSLTAALANLYGMIGGTA